MFMVGLRRLDGMPDAEKSIFMHNLRLHLSRQETFSQMGGNVNNKLLFAEMYVRFHKEYIPSQTNDWNIAYFKVATFDVIKAK